MHKKYHIPTVIITSTNVTLSPVMYGYGSRLKNPMKNNHNNSSDLLNQTNGSVTNNTSSNSFWTHILAYLFTTKFIYVIWLTKFPNVRQFDLSLVILSQNLQQIVTFQLLTQ